MKRSKRPVLVEGEITCCYAESEKSWICDPQGILRETFLTMGESTVYGEDRLRPAPTMKSACCTAITSSVGAEGSVNAADSS